MITIWLIKNYYSVFGILYVKNKFLANTLFKVINIHKVLAVDIVEVDIFIFLILS